MATGPPTLLLQVNTSSLLQQMTGFLPEESPSKSEQKKAKLPYAREDHKSGAK